MPERIKDLPSFLEEMARLLDLISKCRDVLFRHDFRRNLSQAIEKEVVPELRRFREHEYIRQPEKHDEMISAGMVGAQLNLKLESFESSLAAFESEAGEYRLKEALDTGQTILASLAGAVPGFGSFAQELVEFILKELRKRLRIWR